MTKVIAITEIHRTVEPGVPGDKAKGIAAIAPKTQIIPPGSILDATGEELKELRKLKAVRDPAPGEKIGVSIDPDDTDMMVQAKLAAARAGMSTAPEQDDDGKSDLDAAAKAEAKKKAQEAKAKAKAATGKPGADDASNLV